MYMVCYLNLYGAEHCPQFCIMTAIDWFVNYFFLFP